MWMCRKSNLPTLPPCSKLYVFSDVAASLLQVSNSIWAAVSCNKWSTTRCIINNSNNNTNNSLAQQ
ncbi:unnamed protein product [Ceratitis capitata]|uniref:(Mediterranean fruit fly) hypothetical protein n=1 Tax=Ceratitis capitata TaxID=7213 RepID=A0A811V087_CERCA|nr:unnamed protein product [Ceratitis capitata]